MATRNINVGGDLPGRGDRQRTLDASQETLRSITSYLNHFPDLETSSYFQDPQKLPPLREEQKRPKLRIAVFQHSEMLDWATAWQDTRFAGKDGLFENQQTDPPPNTPPLSINNSIATGGGTRRVLVINAAHPEKLGGDWVQCMGTQEDTLCRRSTLSHSLSTPHPEQNLEGNSFYPLEHGGIYSPNVIVFRKGPAQDYKFLPPEHCTILSVASVSPQRTPRLTEDGQYVFEIEEILQRESMQNALRIAATHGHVNIVIPMFGSVNREVPEPSRRRADGRPESPPDVNPVREVARLWWELLDQSEEFDGYFENVVFLLGTGPKASEEAAALACFFKLPQVNELLKQWFPGFYDYLDAHLREGQ